MPVPKELLDAIVAEGGGKVLLVVGAGCSIEAPTSLLPASRYAEEAFNRLVVDGIIDAGTCTDPRDLSRVADAVWAARGMQRDLVERLPHHEFRECRPNEGHLIAAALLAEQSLLSIVTSNFDLAISHAIQKMGATAIAIIEGPRDHGRLALVNLIYLHRNARANPEEWILRTGPLTDEWHGSWQEAITQRFLNTPVLVFAGLGTLIGAVVETTRRIRQMVPAEGALVYQVDVLPREESAFAHALEIAPGFYLQMSWLTFMLHLGAYWAETDAQRTAEACRALLEANGWPPEDIESLRVRVAGLGMLGLGSFRARCFLYDGTYLPALAVDRLQLADLLVCLAYVERLSGATATISEDAVVEFRSGQRLIGSTVLASGRGVKSWIRLDAEIRQQEKYRRYRNARPRRAVVTGVWGARPAALTPPPNLTVEAEPQSILLGDALADFDLLSVAELRADPALVAQIMG